MSALTIIGVVILSAIFIAVVYRVVKTFTQVVPQEQQLVIYRLGRFHRVVGPGPVPVIPKLEQVVRAIEVRDHPIEVTVPGIFAFGVPNDLTLNLWCSFDPVRAAGRDRDKLAKFVQVYDSERRRQVEVKMREALVQQVAELQERMPLPDGATTLDGVLALAPGSEHYNELLAGVMRQLQQTLPTIGVILNASQPITLTGRGLSNEIIEAMEQRRGIDISGETLIKYATKLKRDFPNISDVIVAQILGSIPGVDLGNLQRLLFEKGAGETEIEYEMPGDGGGRVNTIVRSGVGRRESARERSSEPQQYDRAAARADEEPLSESDLAVLKRVPHRHRDQRFSA